MPSARSAFSCSMRASVQLSLVSNDFMAGGSPVYRCPCLKRKRPTAKVSRQSQIAGDYFPSLDARETCRAPENGSFGDAFLPDGVRPGPTGLRDGNLALFLMVTSPSLSAVALVYGPHRTRWRSPLVARGRCGRPAAGRR